MTLAPDTLLGPYRIRRLIGAGGMGEVYEAVDVRLERTVAVKVLPHSLANDSDRRKRFEREARAISSLNHPHIGTVDDECLHVRPLFTYAARSQAVDEFVWYYNHQRPHQSLGGMTPVGRRKLYFHQAG